MKLIVIPDYLPKTYIEVDSKLKGKKLKDYIESYKEKLNRPSKDMISACWRRNMQYEQNIR